MLNVIKNIIIDWICLLKQNNIDNIVNELINYLQLINLFI